MACNDQMCIGKKVGGDFSVVITTFDRMKDTNGSGKPLWQITALSILKQQKTNFLFNLQIPHIHEKRPFRPNNQLYIFQPFMKCLIPP